MAIATTSRIVAIGTAFVLAAGMVLGAVGSTVAGPADRSTVGMSAADEPESAIINAWPKKYTGAG